MLRPATIAPLLSRPRVHIVIPPDLPEQTATDLEGHLARVAQVMAYMDNKLVAVGTPGTVKPWRLVASGERHQTVAVMLFAAHG